MTGVILDRLVVLD
jgi:hypothetical protein